MKNDDRTERRLRELFAAGRRADRDETPGFRAVLHRVADEARPRVAWWRSPGTAALATSGSLAVAFMSFWLYFQQPEALRVPPTAMVEMATAIVAESGSTSGVSRTSSHIGTQTRAASKLMNRPAHAQE